MSVLGDGSQWVLCWSSPRGDRYIEKGPSITPMIGRACRFESEEAAIDHLATHKLYDDWKPMEVPRG